MNERTSLQGPGRFNRRAVKVADAQAALLAAVSPAAASEPLPLWQAAGRVLAEPLAAASDWPPFARAGMDGFAVRAADIAQATPESPAVLRVTGTVGAGGMARGPVLPGTAVRIMTGAAVPGGADAVVMLEMTADALAADGSEAVAVKQPAEPGRNVARAGEEFRRGDVLAAAGTVVRPGHVALFGMFGYAEVRVFRRPRVAVFATGTELLPVGSPLVPGRIRDSNSAMIAALLLASGADALPLGCLPDDPDTVAAAIASALETADAVLTTGGVSVGDFDVMAALLARLRSEACPDSRVLFDKVAMRPGSPTSAALIGGKPLVALSGNPAACFVGYHLFAHPVVRRLQGDPSPLLRERTAELARPVVKPSPHERFVRVRLIERDGRLYADPLGFDKSGMTASLPESDALARIPAGPRGAAAGELVGILVL